MSLWIFVGIILAVFLLEPPRFFPALIPIIAAIGKAAAAAGTAAAPVAGGAGAAAGIGAGAAGAGTVLAAQGAAPAIGTAGSALAGPPAAAAMGAKGLAAPALAKGMSPMMNPTMGEMGLGASRAGIGATPIAPGTVNAPAGGNLFNPAAMGRSAATSAPGNILKALMRNTKLGYRDQRGNSFMMGEDKNRRMIELLRQNLRPQTAAMNPSPTTATSTASRLGQSPIMDVMSNLFSARRP